MNKKQKNKKQKVKEKLKELLLQKDWPQIETLCSDWLEWEPQRARTYYSRSLALVAMQRYEEAVADLEKCLELKPHLEPAIKLLPKVRKTWAKLEASALKKPLVVSVEDPIIVALEQPLSATKARKKVPREKRTRYFSLPDEESQ